jgi:transcriptional regulator with XRE-family HTH domain
MDRKRPAIFPEVQRNLNAFGSNLKLARLRRKISAELMAERADISRTTLYEVEKGSETVSIGAYISVLRVLGMDEEIAKLALDDELGRKLQDIGLLVKKRAPKRKKDSSNELSS